MYWKWRYGPNGEADPTPGLLGALLLVPFAWPVLFPLFIYFALRKPRRAPRTKQSRYERILKDGFERYKKSQRDYSLDNEKEFNQSLDKANRKTEELLKKYENADEETKRKMEREASLHDQYMDCYIFDTYRKRLHDERVRRV